MENPENGSASTDADNREAMWDELDNNVEAQPDADTDVKEDDETQEGDIEETLSEDEPDTDPEGDKVEETQEVKAETSKSDDDDFLSTLDPETRGKVEEKIKLQEEKFEQQRKSDEGRIKAAQRQAYELSKTRQKLAEYEKKEQDAANQKLAEKFEEIPELGEVINSVQNQFDEKLRRVEQNGQELRNQLENDILKRSEEIKTTVLLEHPDFDQMGESGEFEKVQAFAYAADKPENNFAQIFDSNNLHLTDAVGVSTLLTAYKDFKNPNRAKPQEPQASADDVKTLARRRQSQQQATEQAVSSSNVVTKTGIPEQGSREQLWDSFKNI